MKVKSLVLPLLIISSLSVISCNDDEINQGIVLPPDSGNTNNKGNDEPEIPTSFVIPNTVYSDDYRSFASWSQKNKWNLANVHDPSVVCWNGTYYMFGTDASYGNAHEECTSGKHFQGKKSNDLVYWSWIPGPLDEAPQWCLDSLNSYRKKMNLSQLNREDINFGYWAPVVRKITVNGAEKIRMYYSIVIDNYIKTGAKANTEFDGSWTERAFIGMCETTNPEGGPSAWEDKGFVTCSSTDLGRDKWERSSTNDWNGYFYYNAIDPTYIVTPEGKHYLIHGSWHSGFAILELDGTTGKPLNELGDPWFETAEELQAHYGKRIATRDGDTRWQASEGPEIIYKDGYYYLFMAWDPLGIPYNTRVLRSESIEGPFVDARGTDFTNGGGSNKNKMHPIVTHPYKFKNGKGWVGISHCCVFQNESNKDWFLMSQARLPENAGGNAPNAVMLGHVRKLIWCPATPDDLDDLWPIALPERYANIESGSYSKNVDANEIAGKYELIILDYDYGSMDVAENKYLLLKEDGTMSGPITGTWSYDPAKKYLTLTSESGYFKGSDKEIGSMIVCVEREADWEKGDVTLVFAGFHKRYNAALWGKRVGKIDDNEQENSGPTTVAKMTCSNDVFKTTPKVHLVAEKGKMKVTSNVKVSDGKYTDELFTATDWWQADNSFTDDFTVKAGETLTFTVKSIENTAFMVEIYDGKAWMSTSSTLDAWGSGDAQGKVTNNSDTKSYDWDGTMTVNITLQGSTWVIEYIN